uniref:Uncharacterized protein n=1 Tax=Anopheles merus TaxID=30066 RepID=A0A182VNU6_ANOME
MSSFASAWFRSSSSAFSALRWLTTISALRSWSVSLCTSPAGGPASIAPTANPSRIASLPNSTALRVRINRSRFTSPLPSRCSVRAEDTPLALPAGSTVRKLFDRSTTSSVPGAVGGEPPVVCTGAHIAHESEIERFQSVVRCVQVRNLGEACDGGQLGELVPAEVELFQREEEIVRIGLQRAGTIVARPYHTHRLGNVDRGETIAADVERFERAQFVERVPAHLGQPVAGEVERSQGSGFGQDGGVEGRQGIVLQVELLEGGLLVQCLRGQALQSIVGKVQPDQLGRFVEATGRDGLKRDGGRVQRLQLGELLEQGGRQMGHRRLVECYFAIRARSNARWTGDDIFRTDGDASQQTACRR